MRKGYIIFMVVWVIGIFSGSLFSQFKIKPTVEVSIIKEDNCNSRASISKVYLKNELEDKTDYIVNVLRKKTSEIYDVKIGTYLISYEYKLGGIKYNSPSFSLIDSVFIDDEDGSIFSKMEILNKIIIEKNKNVKINLILSSKYSGNYIIKNKLTKGRYNNLYDIYINIGETIENDLNNNLQKPINYYDNVQLNTYAKDSNTPNCSCCKTGISVWATYNGRHCSDFECNRWKHIQFNEVILKSDHSFRTIEKPAEDIGTIITQRYGSQSKTGTKIGNFSWDMSVDFEGIESKCCDDGDCGFCAYKINKVVILIKTKISMWVRNEFDEFIRKKNIILKNQGKKEIDPDCEWDALLKHEKYHCKSFYDIVMEKFQKKEWCKVSRYKVLCGKRLNHCLSGNSRQELKKAFSIINVKSKDDLKGMGERDHLKLYGPNGIDKKNYKECIKEKK